MSATAKDLSKWYYQLKEVKPENFNKFPVNEFLKKNELKGKDPGQIKTAMILFAKMAHQLDEKEFIHSVQSGDVPALKLTKEEMAVVKGGIIPFLIIGGIIAGGIALWNSL